MSGLRDLIVNVVAAIVVFALGVAARNLVSTARSRRGRQFWGRQIIRGRTRLFLGSFNRFYALEPSGLVGVGDNHALHELTTELGHLGIFFEIAYAQRLADRQHEENLILLGFGDVNDLAPIVFDKIQTAFQFDVDAMVINDAKTGNTYAPEWEHRQLDNEEISELGNGWWIDVDQGRSVARRFVADYGVFIRTHSPFNSGRTLIIIAGIYGFGTWAGARLPLDVTFLRRCADVGIFGVECLYRVELLQGQLLQTSIVELRALPTEDVI